MLQIARSVALYCCLFFAYTINVDAQTHYNIRVDIRFGYKFYSIFIDNNSRAYVIRGNGSGYLENFKIITSDTSHRFKLSHINLFYRDVDKLKAKPRIMNSSVTDSPRVEIYYEGKKIYDGQESGTMFWEMFKPVMLQLPKGYNPLLLDDHPFG
jgi:hypothetical protein